MNLFVHLVLRLAGVVLLCLACAIGWVFTGVALVFNIAFTLFSGTAPLLATALIREMETVRAPALLMSACGLLALGGSTLIPRYGGHVLDERGH